MARGGQTLDGFGGRGHVGGQVGGGQVAPQKWREINDMGAVDRQTRQDRHAGLPGKPAIGLRITRAAYCAIMVKVEAG